MYHLIHNLKYVQEVELLELLVMERKSRVQQKLLHKLLILIH